MATRAKTIEFAWDNYDTLVTDAVLTSLGIITVYVPENSPGTPVVFKSAMIEVHWSDVVTATGGTITEHRVALAVGGAGATTITELDDIANTGENMGGVIGPFNFLAQFTSNFGTGQSNSCEVSVYFDQTTGTTLGMRPVGAKLILTYEYDDTVSTHIKTIRIPFESRNLALAATKTQIGTNQIPVLDTFLPESGVVVRDWFIVMEGNQNNAATTDITLNCEIDALGSRTFGIFERALGSDIFVRVIYKPTVPDTSSVHAFYVWANAATSFHNLVITLYVTYEFTPASSTRILNSVIVPIEIGSPMGLLTTGASRFQRNLFVQEPGTITMLQSSFRINYNVGAAVSGMNYKAGAQAYKAYTDNGSTVCGMFSLQQRIDSGSSQGAALTLARGVNSLVVDMYRTDTTDDPTNINGYFIINYTSDKHTDGVGVHAKTLFFLMAQWDAQLTDRFLVSAYSLGLTPANYWVMSAGVVSTIWDTGAANAFTMDVQVNVGEGKGAGFEDLYSDAVASDAERRCSIVWMRGRDVFKRYPQDPDPDRLDLEVSRDWRFFTAATTSQGLMFFITYHAITYTVSGTVSNYSGDGSGITVRFQRTDTNEKILELTTAVGGGFSGLWYDNTIELQATAYQDATHKGVSARATGGNTFNIDFGGAGGGNTYSRSRIINQ